MKKWFTGFSMCWGMFCAIPNPIRRWDSGCYRQMLLCLPFLGGALGLIWTGIGLLLLRISAPGPILPVHDGSALVSHRLYPSGWVHGLL